MRTLVLARHAESELNLTNVLNGDPSRAVSLTPRGRDQARLLGREAGRIDLAAHTSFGRTRETAALAWPEAPRLVVPELNEISYGRWEGTRWGDGYDEWVRTTDPLEAAPGGGESRVDAIRRFLRGYRRMLECDEEQVALVAHGAQVRYILLALAGTAPPPLLEGVPPAMPFALPRDQFERAVALIEAWAEDPRWA